MATLVFSAIGTLIGGPLGGAIGALAGRQVDGMILPRSARDGPRLTELAVSTSSYGMAIPRVFGTVRVPGSVIWSTDLSEQRDRASNGKGRPATITYSYTASFAVALSSRRARTLGRIWADGRLLRGAAGDLKVPGTLRFHSGADDQPADSLIASAEGSTLCPAHRGLAYVMFEDLHLGEFGNRIPALTFEVIADAGELSAAMLLETLGSGAISAIALPELRGLTLAGPPADLLDLIDQVVPLDCHAAADRIEIGQPAAAPVLLGEPAIAASDDSFGRNAGQSSQRQPAAILPIGVLRYYDPERDYQPGAQRAQHQPRGGQGTSLDLPATVTATDARRLIERIGARRNWARETLMYRSASLDPALVPGRLVTVPGRAGLWKIHSWEWRADGVELELLRTAQPLELGLPGVAGRAGLPPDLAARPSLLHAFELPWDGTGSSRDASVWAAASSTGPGWPGGALLAEQPDGTLTELNQAARARAIIGTVLVGPVAHTPHLLDRTSSIEIELASADMVLAATSIETLLQGANRALVGDELLQFAHAEQLAPQRWRLSGLLRGRGGTEFAVTGHQSGEPFVLLDHRLVAVDAALLPNSPSSRIGIIGLADPAPVLTNIRQRGITLRPLEPVHGTAARLAGGGLDLSWVRRARGAWAWLDGVDTALNEQSEAWQIDFGQTGESVAQWTRSVSWLDLDQRTWTSLQAQAPGGNFRIRQIGTHGISSPLTVAP